MAVVAQDWKVWGRGGGKGGGGGGGSETGARGKPMAHQEQRLGCEEY